ncbi:UNVERIFIED_CONTAM: TetR family transcriptional regulator [Williamsia faeni]
MIPLSAYDEVMAETENTVDVLRADARENLNRILVSAREVFATAGLDATLADVAKHAKVGVGTIYRRFENKEGLIEALFASRLEDVAAMARAADAMADPWEGLLHFLNEGAVMMARDRALRELMFTGPPKAVQSTASRDDLATDIAETHKVIDGAAESLVSRAIDDGRLRADFTATDLPVLAFSIQATAQLAHGYNPELWRRTMGIIVDGMRASRTGVTPLDAEPLTSEQMAEVFVVNQTGTSIRER